MRELTVFEVEEVSGGDFVSTVGLGVAVGAVGFGGLTMAGGYSAAAIGANFAIGGGVVGTLAGVGFIGYYGATMLGAGSVGSSLGTWLAGECA